MFIRSALRSLFAAAVVAATVGGLALLAASSGADHQALATADRYLHAWQTGDVETGMVLLTAHAKERATTDILEDTFSGAGAASLRDRARKDVAGGALRIPGRAGGSGVDRQARAAAIFLHRGLEYWRE